MGWHLVGCRTHDGYDERDRPGALPVGGRRRARAGGRNDAAYA